MFHIGDKPIGDGTQCFITFEIGPTHNGVDSAKRLIKSASDAGADAVKVQILDPDRLVSDRHQLFKYEVLVNRETGETETIEEPLYDILMRRYLNENQWKEVKAYSDDFGMAFFSTVSFEEDIELLEKLGCDSIKIASADVNHVPLLRRAANTGMCIQLDTGMATLGEIENAVDVIYEEGNQNVVIHQCPSGYPARLESINLNVIPTLKRMFSCPVAYSDHSPGMEMDIAALAIGANLIEKTITEDRMTRSIEHQMSIEPKEMKKFVQTIRDVEVALGSNRRLLEKSQKEHRKKIRRSIFLSQTGRAGQALKDCAIEYRRPGLGVPPNRYDELKNLPLKTDLNAGHMLQMKDLDWIDS